MNIGIDVSAAAGGKLSGVGYHIINLISEIDKQLPPEDKLILFVEGGNGNSIKLLKSRFDYTLKNSKFIFIPFITTSFGPLRRLKDKHLWYWFVKLYNCNLFHGIAHTVPSRLPCPSIVTIHDLAFFDFDLYDTDFSKIIRQKVIRSVKESRGVICLSENTRKDVEKHIGTHPSLKVIYGAGNFAAEDNNLPETHHELETLDKCYSITSPYLLYVGDFVARKNLPYLLKSFSLYCQNHSDNLTQLVLVGAKGEAEEKLRDIAKELKINNQLIMPGRVSTEHLKLIYRNARAFTLPSLAEGFGMVLLEAMSYQLPVITTKTSCMQESAGNAAIFVELNNEKQYSNAVNEVLNNDNTRTQLIKNGLERIKLFNWKNAAKETLDFYNKHS